jgi:hypothetical protein
MTVRNALKLALLLFLSALVTALPPALLYPNAAMAQSTGVGPDAVDALGRMTKTLAAKQFSFTLADVPRFRRAEWRDAPHRAHQQNRISPS